MAKRKYPHRKKYDDKVNELRASLTGFDLTGLSDAEVELVKSVQKRVWRDAYHLESGALIEMAIRAETKEDCLLHLRMLRSREGPLALRHLENIANDLKLPNWIREVANELLSLDAAGAPGKSKGQYLTAVAHDQTSHGFPGSSPTPINAMFVMNQFSNQKEPNIMATQGDSINIEKADQIGAVGREANLQNANFTHQGSAALDFDFVNLTNDLVVLLEAMNRETTGEPQQMVAIEAVSVAEKEARAGNKDSVLKALAKAGTWSLTVATSVGVGVAVAAIKTAMGLH